jgi:hypothetical protein
MALPGYTICKSIRIPKIPMMEKEERGLLLVRILENPTGKLRKDHGR